MNLRKFFSGAAISVSMLFAAMPARAGFPVLDAANLANSIQQVLAWSQDSEFWQGNILSMPKFREKFDTLKHQMFADQRRQRGRSISNPAQARIQNNLSVVAQLEAEAELNERVIAQ